MTAQPATGIKLPEDIDLEQAVIGACLAQPDMVPDIAACCAPSDFFHAPHGRIVEAIFALHADNQPITVLMVGAKMAGDTGLQDCGGNGYLDAMRQCAPSTGILALARNVAELRLRREAIHATLIAQEALAIPATGIVEALRPVLQMADKAADELGRRERIPLAEAAALMLKRAEARANGEAIVSATTGLDCLDKAIGGLQGGDLVVFAGRPGMGKSAALATSALRTAMTGRPVLFFSLEMTREALLQRIGADLDFDAHPTNPLSYSWFRNGTAKHDQIGRLADALRALPESLEIFEDGSLTIQEMAAIARAKAARSHSMGLVVIDYLQKIAASDRYKGNRVQEVTEISGAAKALAMRLKWPVLVGAQLNRGVESREGNRPTLTDLRESGSIEQDADCVVGLFRPAYYIEKRKPAAGSLDPAWQAWQVEYEPERHRLDLYLLKNRNGAEDSMKVFCDMRASAIRDEKPRLMA